MDKLYIIIPAYNEEETIKSVIAQWHPMVEGIGPESRLVVIDDGSQDNTYKIASELKDAYPQLTVLTKENQGHGPTVLRGYRYAIRHGADYVFQTDSDGQTLPSEFSRFWRNRKKCGILIGYRRKRGDGASRVFVTKVLRMTLLAIFGVWVKDANSPYRLMQCSQLRSSPKSSQELFPVECADHRDLHQEKHGSSLLPHYVPAPTGWENTFDMKALAKTGWKAVGQFMAMRRRIAR